MRLLHWWRKKRNLNQSQWAVFLGVSRQAVVQWESGRSAPSVARLEKIVPNIGVTLARFYGAERYL